MVLYNIKDIIKEIILVLKCWLIDNKKYNINKDINKEINKL